jgi:hypothetical protein
MGEDCSRHGFPFSFDGASKRESRGTAISPLVGEMPDRAEGGAST